MKSTVAIILICLVSIKISHAQNFGEYPKIEKAKLLNDLEILYQGLDKFHSGMYWYTTKDSVDSAFQEVRHGIAGIKISILSQSTRKTLLLSSRM